MARRPSVGDDHETMPVELIAFTADRRIRGAIPLADDRLSDMLNSVPRVVVRGAEVADLVDGGAPTTADVTITVGSIMAVLVSGRRGVETRRRKTELHPVRIGLLRYVVSGRLHVPAGSRLDRSSDDPSVVLAGRDLLVPVTDATITYDRGGESVSETFETILVNRAHAAWIDLDDVAGADDETFLPERPTVYHAPLPRTVTRAR